MTLLQEPALGPALLALDPELREAVRCWLLEQAAACDARRRSHLKLARAIERVQVTSCR